MALLQRDRLTPQAAVRALLVSGTASADEAILARVRWRSRARVRRQAESLRTTGTRGVVLMSWRNGEQDLVWAEMLSYWEQTGQLNPGEATAWSSLDDEGVWRDLGYQVSYGTPYAGVDPQGGADAPWGLGPPTAWSEWAAGESWLSTGAVESAWMTPAVGGAR